MIRKILVASALVIAGAGFAPVAAAAESTYPLERAPNRQSDMIALQNGARLFVNHCLNCHSANVMRYNKLADLGLTEDQIDDVWRWHRITARRQAQTAGGVAIVRLLTYMLTGHKDADLHLRLVGLAFGVGMGHITGHEHQAAAAHALGVSRQAVADAGERARKAILG